MQTVRSAWKPRQGDADAIYAAVQQRLSTARVRNEKLVNLFLDGNVDQQTYRGQSARLSKEIDSAEQELRIAESEFLDLEAVLAFAKKIVTSPTRLWLESSLDQRQKPQVSFFPDGLVFINSAIGTTVSSLFFQSFKGKLRPR
jgi:hypothetical protein